jgi:hypothetical protein
MIYYGQYDENGTYITFYNEEVNGKNIPKGCIELTEIEWNQAITGDYKVINGKHTKYNKSQKELDDEELVGIRMERDILLSQCDWTQLNDVPMTELKRMEWKLYRQKLRDITKSKPYIFPTKPDK